MMHPMLEDDDHIPEEIGSIAASVNHQVLNLLMIADLMKPSTNKEVGPFGRIGRKTWPSYWR